MRLAQLEALIKERGITREEFAKAINMSYQALTNRLSGRVEFDVSEVRQVAIYLELDAEQVIRCFYLI